MSSNVILWVTTVLMGAGGLSILFVGKRRTSSEATQTILHGTVPIIAACSYLAMATGQGLLALPTDAALAAGAATPTRVLYFARYIDWAFTTPLLLASLSLVAMHGGPKRWGYIAGALIADVLMIATAFVFSASEQEWTRWTWFIVSCVAFLGVYYVVWGPQLEASRLERDDVRSSYKRFATFLSVVWLFYPVVLAAAPDGLGVLSDEASVLAIAVLDVVSKVVYGLLCIAADAKTIDRDLLETRAGTGPATRLAA